MPGPRIANGQAVDGSHTPVGETDGLAVGLAVPVADDVTGPAKMGNELAGIHGMQVAELAMQRPKNEHRMPPNAIHSHFPQRHAVALYKCSRPISKAQANAWQLPFIRWLRITAHTGARQAGHGTPVKVAEAVEGSTGLRVHERVPVTLGAALLVMVRDAVRPSVAVSDADAVEAVGVGLGVPDGSVRRGDGGSAAM